MRDERAAEILRDTTAGQAWEIAQRALEDARQIASGIERVEALKWAGKLRFEADKMRRAEEAKIRKA